MSYRPECEVCGDQDHSDDAHETVSSADWSWRNEQDMVSFALAEAESLGADVADLRTEFEALPDVDDPDLDVDTLTDTSQALHEMLTDVEGRLSDAGFYAGSDGYSGTWWIVRPAPPAFDPETAAFPVGSVVKVDGHGGVAFRIDSYTRDGMAECHMVGDDRTWIVDPADATILDDEDYCGGCGQTDCGW